MISARHTSSPTALHPLSLRDFEVAASTTSLADGDILHSENFPELPPLQTPHVYRFLRDGRKASEDRLRALGGAAYCYLTLHPMKGHAIIVPNRWSLEMFCRQFSVTRPLPVSTVPVTPTVTILRRPNPTVNPEGQSRNEGEKPPENSMIDGGSTPKSSLGGERKPSVRPQTERWENEEPTEEMPGPSGITPGDTSELSWDDDYDPTLVEQTAGQLLLQLEQQLAADVDSPQISADSLAELTRLRKNRKRLIALENSVLGRSRTSPPPTGTRLSSYLQTSSATTAQMEASVATTTSIDPPKSSVSNGNTVILQVPKISGPFWEWMSKQPSMSVDDPQTWDFMNVLESQFAFVADKFITGITGKRALTIKCSRWLKACKLNNRLMWR